jgi:hypothetical protein
VRLAAIVRQRDLELESESEPLNLGQAAAAQVRLIVWCKSRNHRAEPDVAIQVAQHGVGMTVIDWARLLRCTECGARDADFVERGEAVKGALAGPSTIVPHRWR